MDDIKKKYILFSKLHLNHLLFLFFFIISCFKKGMQIYFEQDHRISIDFIKLYVYDFGDFLSILPLLIIKYRMRNMTKIQNIKRSISMSQNYNNKGNEKTKCNL